MIRLTMISTLKMFILVEYSEILNITHRYFLMLHYTNEKSPNTKILTNYHSTFKPVTPIC